MIDFAKLALDEYNGDTKTVRHGGQNGKNFWNSNSSQFMFVPNFQFPEIPGGKEYRFTATDCNGKTHTFVAETPTAPLTPIWKDIPTGMVELKVEASHETNGKTYLIGARTFFKSAPFPGRDALPPRACSYKECATKALRYVFEDPATRHWLTHALPDPNYYHNVYPSKMISSIVRAMISYAKLEPQNAQQAMQLARNAADYLLSITYPEGSALEGLPPTYCFKGLNKEIVDATAPAADGRKETLMTIYPAHVGSMYLLLEKETGDEKYFEAARRIAQYYQKTVLPNASWHLLVSTVTGEAISYNCCSNFSILEFLNDFYQRTKEECWNTLQKNYFDYLQKTCLEQYNWEGQFEDIALSGNYRNLTHFSADATIRYIAEHHSDDVEQVKEAEQLMRYVEDQFVVWGEFAPWRQECFPDNPRWYSPAGLEQYFWHVPIDASTSTIMDTFLTLYNVTKNPLLLEKACALGDSITRMQNPETGVIPTHWMKEDCTTNLENFWINCHIACAFHMMTLAEAVGEI